MPSIAPDLRPDDDELVPCPQCHAWMIELAGFNVDDATELSPDSDLGAAYDYDFQHYGGRTSQANAFLDALWNLVSLQFRRKKVARLQAEMLPAFPRSLICTRCLAIKRIK